MKRITISILLITACTGLFAQLPQNWDPFSVDTLDVPTSYNDGSQFQPALAYYLLSDTSSTGARNENRVYRLQRYKSETDPGIYILDGTMNIDFALKLVAEKGTTRIPMIAPGYNTEGGVIDDFFVLLGDNQNHVFKNIFFQRINLERTFIDDWETGIRFSGDNLRVEIEGCVFNAFTAASVVFGGQNNSMFFRDNVWRNGQWPSHPFVGQQIGLGGDSPQDTLIFTNNIYFNNNSNWLSHSGEFFDHVVVEHNTLITSAVPAVKLKFLVNANFRSNLFYGYAAYGDTELARTSGSWYEPDGDSLAHFSLDALGRLVSLWDKPESERRINLSHNAYFTPQPLKDYYDAHANYISPKDGSVDPVTPPLWMNKRTKDMFDDDDSFPNLFEDSNYSDMDPMFANTEVATWVSEAIALWCTEMRTSSTEQGWGSASNNRNYELALGHDIMSGVQWPLPEGKFEITNPQLLTGGHDGLPVGCLNWNPALRAKYKEPKIIGDQSTSRTDIKEQLNLKIYLTSNGNILNVTNDELIQSIEVFNLVGKKLIYNNNIESLTSQLNISTLKNGVYIVRVNSNKLVNSKKFIK